MRVCVVSKATAQHFKRGTRLPSPQAQRLWEIHIQGRFLGAEWGRYRVHRDELIDSDGLVYTAGEIATLPFLHAQIAELRKQLDKARYADSMGELGFFELADALRGLLQDGAKLLTAVEKIPRRTSFQPRPCQDGRLEEQPSDPTVHNGVVPDHA
ncbi:MAG TPA: hypothetical protein VMQ83_08615 [Gammaproteobacteria bacterium]|nr:hypothetical protein [Gammaproteobacteria bacterium]